MLILLHIDGPQTSLSATLYCHYHAMKSLWISKNPLIPTNPACLFWGVRFSAKKLILKRHWGNLFLTKVSNSAQNQVWGSQICTYNLFTYLFIWKDVTVAIFSAEFSSFTSNNLSILNTFGRHTGLQAMVNNKKLQNYPCLPVPAAPLCNPLAFLPQTCHEKHWRAIDHCEFL